MRLAERITSPKRIAEQVGVSRRNVSRVLAGFAPAPLVDDPLLMPGERRVAAGRCA